MYSHLFSKKIYLFFLCLSISIRLFSQQNYNNWTCEECTQRPSQWYKCLVIAPGYMGPNALPVPEIQTALVRNRLELEVTSENYFGKWDNTHNLFVKAYIPIAKGKVAVEMYGVPLEYYRSAEQIQAERMIVPWNYKKEEYTIGDLYVGTIVQILRDKKYLPDVSISAHFKTASGGNLKNARFTDAPAYFFNTAFGKVLPFRSRWLDYVHFYANFGFYVWQTYSDSFPQDDAFLYGVGINLKSGKYMLHTQTGGYQGYIQQDKPVVLRLQLSREFKKFNALLGYQWGIRHFPFQTLRVGVSYFFRNNKEEKIESTAL